MSPQTWFSVLDIDLVWAFTVQVIFSLAAGLIAGYGRRRTWASPSWAVAACVASVGLVVALTLPPTSSSFTESWCSTTITGLPSLSGGLLTHDLLNIALLIPLGVSVTFLRPPRTALVAGAITITVPLFVEWVQYLTPGNGHSCSLQDAALNVIGLVLGLLGGVLIHLVMHLASRQDTSRTGTYT